MSHIEISSQSRDESPPNIFKLTTDCCDEIFEYLSLKDLHSFGQTCRAMQKVAGEYFKRNYSLAAKYSGNDGIYTAYSDDNGVINKKTQTSGFNRYITYISHYYDNLRPLHYIRSHSDEFESIKHIYLVCIIINEARVNCLLNLLPKLETLQIRNSSVEGDLNEMLLQHCPTLKRLLVQESDLGVMRLLDGGWVARIENHWLLQAYPHLKYLELIPKYTVKIDELNDFFERNPNVREFSTSLQCLWTNRQQLLKSTALLDLLEVKEFPELEFDEDIDEIPNMQAICQLLNQLYERNFYKRVNLYLPIINEISSMELPLLKGLKKLYIKNFTKNYCLPQVIGLKEMGIGDWINARDFEILASSLVHLHLLHVNNANIDNIAPFIRMCPKLRQVIVTPKDEAQFNGGILKLLTLNREREKLNDARKVTIFVPDDLFLRTKWRVNNGDMNLKLVEMKRVDSVEWDDHY